MILSIAYFSNTRDNFFHYFKRYLTIFTTSYIEALWPCWPCNNQVVSSNLTGVLFLFFTGFFKNSEKNCRQYLKNMQLIISFPFSCTYVFWAQRRLSSKEFGSSSIMRSLKSISAFDGRYLLLHQVCDRTFWAIWFMVFLSKWWPLDSSIDEPSPDL